MKFFSSIGTQDQNKDWSKSTIDCRLDLNFWNRKDCALTAFRSWSIVFIIVSQCFRWQSSLSSSGRFHTSEVDNASWTYVDTSARATNVPPHDYLFCGNVKYHRNCIRDAVGDGLFVASIPCKFRFGAEECVRIRSIILSLVLRHHPPANQIAKRITHRTHWRKVEKPHHMYSTNHSDAREPVEWNDEKVSVD